MKRSSSQADSTRANPANFET